MSLSSQFGPSYPAGTAPDIRTTIQRLSSWGLSLRRLWGSFFDKKCSPLSVRSSVWRMQLTWGLQSDRPKWAFSHSSFSSRVPGWQSLASNSLLWEKYRGLAWCCAPSTATCGCPICCRHATVYLRTCALPTSVSSLQHGLPEDTPRRRNYRRSFS